MQNVTMWRFAVCSWFMRIMNHAIGSVLVLIAATPLSGLADDNSVPVLHPKVTLQGHSVRVSSLAFFRDGQTLVSGGHLPSTQNNEPVAIGEIKFWDVPTGREGDRFKGRVNSVISLSLSPDEKLLAVGGAGQFDKKRDAFDGEIKLFEISTGESRTLAQAHSAEVFSVSFALDGKTFASGSWDQKIHLWDVETGRLKSTLSGHDQPVISVAFSRDGRTLASASLDHTIGLWSLKTGFLNSTLHAKMSGGGVYCVSVSQDGKLVAGSTAKGVFIWDVATGKNSSILTQPIRHSNCVAISPNGHFLASGDFDGTVAVFDLRMQKIKAILKQHTQEVRCVKFSPNSKMLASGSWDTTINLWDLGVLE